MTANLKKSLTFLQALIQQRLEQYFSEGEQPTAFQFPPFSIDENDGSHFTQFVVHYNMTIEELVTVLLGLVPNIYPNFFDSLIADYLPKGGEFPEFGGVKGINHRGLLPTGETLLFILAGTDMDRRFEIMRLLHSDHYFAKERILQLESVKYGQPLMSGKLLLDPEYIELFTQGFISLPKLSAQFPAKHLTTQMEWQDIILHANTRNQLKELELWIQHNDTLLHQWGMSKKIKPGYRALFYGPPGTGKTLAATLLGKYTGKEVFRIDLSMIVSKYIGETEKNLATLFDKAHNKNWILFFDEADSIFGKRTGVKDAHDKYANQEVSYLLQRIENYPGLAILASNFKSNIDEAFMRRFNASIFFPFPKPAERLQLWQKAFPEQVEFSKEVNFRTLADKYELTGAHIMNVVHYTCLNALERGDNLITYQSILEGIEKELTKEGKLIA